MRMLFLFTFSMILSNSVSAEIRDEVVWDDVKDLTELVGLVEYRYPLRGLARREFQTFDFKITDRRQIDKLLNDRDESLLDPNCAFEQLKSYYLRNQFPGDFAIQSIEVVDGQGFYCDRWQTGYLWRTIEPTRVYKVNLFSSRDGKTKKAAFSCRLKEAGSQWQYSYASCPEHLPIRGK